MYCLAEFLLRSAERFNSSADISDRRTQSVYALSEIVTQIILVVGIFHIAVSHGFKIIVILKNIFRKELNDPVADL